MLIQPEFYDAFLCRADACGHTCCRGWEIDVDDVTLARYAAVPGDFGVRLRDAVFADEYGAHFSLAEDDRCPFLQRDGLCEIISRLGEDALCDICALHPRFFAEIGPHELRGLGLSCEAACDLLLADDAPLCFLDADSSERMTLPELLGRLGIPCDPAALRFDGAPCSEAYLSRMALTEPIDGKWPGELSALRRALAVSAPALPTGERYDRMLQYILFRQLDRTEETPLPALISFARDSAAFVAAQDAVFGVSAEHLRRWSEQIEYSTENVEILLTFHRQEGV